MLRVSENQLTAYLVEGQARFYRWRIVIWKTVKRLWMPYKRRSAVPWSSRVGFGVRAWFYRILVNVCTDMLRRRKRVAFVPPESLDSGSYEDPLPDDELARQLESLPMEISTIIKLRFYEELSLQEISVITGVHLSAVKTRLYTGLKKLRISLEGATMI